MSLEPSQTHKNFWDLLSGVWASEHTGGLLYRAPDISIHAPDLQEALGKYGETSIFTRTSPPIMYRKQAPDVGKPQFGVLYSEGLLGKGYRVSAFETHPFCRYPFARFFDPGRVFDNKKSFSGMAETYYEGIYYDGIFYNGHAETLYNQLPDNSLPAEWTALGAMGTATSTAPLKNANGSSPQLNIFGIEEASLSGYDPVDVNNDKVDHATGVNPRHFQNAAGLPYLGTLNAWAPYYDSIKTMLAVRNANMLIQDDSTRPEVLKLWAGGFTPSMWANTTLDSPELVIGLFVGHPGGQYSSDELTTHGLDSMKNIYATFHTELDEYMEYYFPEKGKAMIDTLSVVELYNTEWNTQGNWDRGDPSKNLWEQAVTNVSKFVGSWMAMKQDDREDLNHYAQILWPTAG